MVCEMNLAPTAIKVIYMYIITVIQYKYVSFHSVSLLRKHQYNYLQDFDIGLWLPCTRCLLEISELMCHTCDIGILCQHLKCTLSVSALVSLGGQPYKQSPTSN